MPASFSSCSTISAFNLHDSAIIYSIIAFERFKILLLFALKYPTHYEPKDIDKMLEAVSKDKKAGKNGISVAFSGKNMQGIIINDIKPKELIDLFL